MTRSGISVSMAVWFSSPYRQSLTLSFIQYFATSLTCSCSFPLSALYWDGTLASVRSPSFTTLLPSKRRTFTMSENTSL